MGDVRGSLALSDTDPSGATIYRMPSGQPWSPELPLAQPVDPATGISTMPIARGGFPQTTPNGAAMPPQAPPVNGAGVSVGGAGIDPALGSGWQPQGTTPQPPPSAAGADIPSQPQPPTPTAPTAAPQPSETDRVAHQAATDLVRLDKTVYRLETNSGRNVQVSSAGARGPMQIMPATWEKYAQPGEDIDNPQQNMQVGQRIISDLYTRYGGNMDAVLIGYNAGEKWIGTPFNQLPQETQNYLRNAHREWGAPLDEAAIGALHNPNLTTGMTEAQRNYQRQTDANIESERKRLAILQREMDKADPLSAENHRLMRERQAAEDRLERLFEEQMMHPPTDTQRDVMSKFGSLAMMVGVIGGSFARVPAIASLNAAGAAMEAMNANDERQYRHHFDTWKTQMGFMEKALDMQHRSYQEILDDEKLNQAEKWRRLNAQAQIFGDERALDALQAQKWVDLEKMQTDRERAQAQAAHLRAQAEELDAKNRANREIGQVVDADMAQWHDDFVRDNNREPNDNETRIARWNFENQRRAQIPTKAGEKPSYSDWEITDPATGQKRIISAAPAPGGGLIDIDRKPINIDPQHVRKVGVATPPTREPYAGPDTWPGMPRKPPPGIDPGVWSMALDYVNSGHPPAALGRASPEQRAAFWQAYPVAQQALGIDPTKESDHWIDYAEKRETRLSIARAFGGGTFGRNLVSLNTVADHISLFRQYAQALRNHDTIRINQLQNRLATEAGSPEVIDYALAARITGDEVVRLLTTTGGTITDREDIAQRLAAYGSPEQFEGAANTLTNYVRGRYGPLRQQFARGDPEKERVFNETMVTPEARTLFEGPQLPIAGAPTSGTKETAPPGGIATPVRPSWADPGFTGPPPVLNQRPIYPDQGKWYFGDDHSPVPEQ